MQSSHSGQSKHDRPSDDAIPRLAVENAEMAEKDTVSDFGQTDAKREAIAEEHARMTESGSEETQRAYLQREAEITDAERERRARAADIHNTVQVQGDKR